MAKKPDREKNLPSVSEQTAGGVAGAVIGGIVAGPVGAVAGGVAGALVGDSSAKGKQPIKKAMERIRSVGVRGAKAIKGARDRNKASRAAKSPTKRPSTEIAASKSAQPKQKRKAKPATKKVPNLAKSKVASKPKSKGTPKRAKKKA
jgi:hypothetical protein